MSYPYIVMPYPYMVMPYPYTVMSYGTYRKQEMINQSPSHLQNDFRFQKSTGNNARM